MTHRSVFFALCLVAIVGGCAGRAPDGVLSGRIDATAHGEIPEGGAFTVAPAGDVPALPVIGEFLTRELKNRGIAIDRGAPTTLSYRVTAVPATTVSEFPDFGLAGVIGSGGTHDVGITIGLPVFGLGAPRRGRHRFVVELTIVGPDGRRIWQGTARGIATTADLGRIALDVLPALLDQIGHTVRARDLLDRTP